MLQINHSSVVLENNLIIVPLVTLAVAITVLLVNYLLIGIVAIVICLSILLYGERFLIGLIIVSLLTIVSEFGSTIRLFVQITNFSLLGVLFFKHYGFNFSKYPKIPKSILYFLVLYYFSMIVPTIFSQHFYAGITMIVRQTIFFIIAYIFFSFIKDIIFVKTIIISLIVVSLIIALSSIYQFYDGGFNLVDVALGMRHNLVDVALGMRHRIASIISNPLKATTFFILTIPLVLTFGFSNKYKDNKKIFLFISSILLIGLILIISRSAILVIFLSLMFIIHQLNKNWFKKSIIIMFILALLFFLIEPIYDSISLLFKIKIGLSQRDYFWEMAFNVIKDNPIIGIGPGSFSYEVFNYSPVLLDSWPGRVIIDLYMATQGENPSHNIFLKFASDMGIPGIVSILYFTLLYFKIVNRTLTKAKGGNQEYYLIILAISAAAGSLFIRGLFDSIGILTYGIVVNDLPFWLWFSIIIFFYQQPEEYFNSEEATGKVLLK